MKGITSDEVEDYTEELTSDRVSLIVTLFNVSASSWLSPLLLDILPSLPLPLRFSCFRAINNAFRLSSSFFIRFGSSAMTSITPPPSSAIGSNSFDGP